MIKNKVLFVWLLCLLMCGVISCSSNDPVTDTKEETATLSVSPTDFHFGYDGGEKSMAIECSGVWKIDFTSGSWCVPNVHTSKGEATIKLTATANEKNETRSLQLTVSSVGATPVVFNITQDANPNQGIPGYIAPDKTGMGSDAKVLAGKMKLGWNLGNSLEACSSTTSASETLWGNPATTKAMIDMVKAAGFNAVRIPCAWSGYMENATTYKVKDSWMARVKEVVDYCISNDMYAILNIHWDGGWLEENPIYSAQESVNKKQKALWEQIAITFRDYDEHLLFAGTNEVHANYETPTAENSEVQLSYNQTFVDAVRSTGGRNTWRNLIIQAYNTNIAHAVSFLKIATDATANRLMVEVHYYDPWDFCGEEGGIKFLWGSKYAGSSNVSTWGQEAWVTESFDKMKTNFVDKGYPVILGEYGAIRRTTLTGDDLAKHNDSRANYLEYVTEQAKKHGLVPFYWDNGATGNYGFGIFDRAGLVVSDQAALDAIVKGGNKSVYPF